MHKKRLLFLTGLVLLLLAACYGYYLYSKPHTGTENIEAQVRLSAQELYNAYNSNEQEADKKYIGKIILVTATVADVATGPPAVLLHTGSSGFVSCSLSPLADVSMLKKGKLISVKGRCVGFLADVNLTDCVIINNNN